MLYMVVATHLPESCPWSNKAIREKMMADYQKLPEVNKKYSITSQGTWTFVGGHVTYMMLDAPNAHVINRALIELGILDWNTVIINPIATMQEVLAMM